MTVESDLAGTAEATVKIPANTMKLLRQSYDTREKILDWWLALFVVAALAYTFRSQLRGMVLPDANPNLGKTPNMVPNQGVGNAFPNFGINPQVYTYNMPPSRTIRDDRGPAVSRTPRDPSGQPEFPDLGS